jgi:hypothetical protein
MAASHPDGVVYVTPSEESFTTQPFVFKGVAPDGFEHAVPAVHVRTTLVLPN